MQLSLQVKGQTMADTLDPAHTKLVPLGTLRPGLRAEIHAFVAQPDSTEIDEPFDMAERLRELGFEEGLIVEVLHQAPLGRDPMAVRVGSMTVALRRRDANILMVETL